VNFPPEAVPSVILGPQELPFIENSTLYANTTGSTFVTAGSPVYLRGFGIDINHPTPAEFNPDAPTFDRDGVQTEVKGLLVQLSNLLKGE
jgi:hypothetical protein